MASDDTNTTRLAKHPVIAIYGRAGSGKSELASMLAERGFQRVKFADPLKAALRSILEYTALEEDLINEMIEGNLKETPAPQLGGKSPRHAMQTLGTEWGRDLIHPEFWVNIAREGILYYTNVVGVPVVVDDMRFPNEYAMIKAIGGRILWIGRPGVTIGLGAGHQSEGALDKFMFDYAFLNDGALDDMARYADALAA